MAWGGLAILNALADGPKLTRQLAATLDGPASSLRRCLRNLAERGLVTTAEGAHQITDKGRRALSEGREVTSGPCSGNAASRRGPTLRQRAWRLMRIPRATAGLHCSFSPDFVRLYNEAVGAAAPDSGDGAVPQAGDPAPVAGAPDAAPTVGPGLRPVRAVTPADILAHVRDFGARSQALEAQVNALIDFASEPGGR